jgi:hypothetical protein
MLLYAVAAFLQGNNDFVAAIGDGSDRFVGIECNHALATPFNSWIPGKRCAKESMVKRSIYFRDEIADPR